MYMYLHVEDVAALLACLNCITVASRTCIDLSIGMKLFHKTLHVSTCMSSFSLMCMGMELDDALLCKFV